MMSPPGSAPNLRAFSVSIARIRNVQGTMESAVSLVTVYDVKPFWGFVVTLTFLRLNPSSSNCDGVCTHDVAVAIQQQKFVFSFQDQHFTGVLL
jgi:hypothetical protein